MSGKKYLNIESKNDSLSNLTTPEHNSLAADLRNEILARNILTARTRRKVLNSLDDINDSKEDSRRSKLREKAINEIFSSEKTYLNQLYLILNYFMQPLREKKILRYSEFSSIFGSIDTIYNVNKELLHEMENNLNNVAVAFLKLAPYFKLYSVYAYDYRKSLVTLQEVEGKNREFSKFLQNQESRPEVSKKLSSLLIAPIQRVPRYRLLLKEVLAYTAQSDPDHDLLKESLKEVERVAFHINSLVEEQENAQRLLELQRSLCNQKPSIVKPGRKLIKEGIVMKMAQNGSHGCQRYLIVLSDIILYCKLLKPNPSEPNSLDCRCILPLHKCRVTEIASKGVFTITCQNENLILYCEGSLSSGAASTVEDWIVTLQDAVTKCIDCRKTLRKASSSRKPIRKRHNMLRYDENAIEHRRDYQRKRQLSEINSALSEVSDNAAGTREKRVRINETTKMEQICESLDEELQTCEDNNKVIQNMTLFNLQKRSGDRSDGGVYSKVRGYVWSVGKSIKSIFGR